MKYAYFSLASVDYYPQQDRYYAGGNALNQSIRASQLGCETAFIGALGNDKHGKMLHKLLLQNNVDITHTRFIEGTTATNNIINDENGERFGEDGTWIGGVYENYRFQSEHWKYLRHFQCWSTHCHCPNFMETISRKGPEHSLCVDYLHLPEIQVLEQSIDHVDIAYVGGEKDIVDYLSNIAANTESLIVLTLGKDGSIAFSGKQKFTQPALPVNNIVDTTGCGDAFQAAFTISYLQNKNIGNALKAGAISGRQATSHYGAVNW